jgi:hypothetical protein
MRLGSFLHLTELYGHPGHARNNFSAVVRVKDWLRQRWNITQCVHTDRGFVHVAGETAVVFVPGSEAGWRFCGVHAFFCALLLALNPHCAGTCLQLGKP